MKRLLLSFSVVILLLPLMITFGQPNPPGRPPAQPPVARGNEQIAAPTTLSFSVRLPAGWGFQTLPGNSVYSTQLAIGDSAASLLAASQAITIGQMQANASGLLGGVLQANPTFWRRYAPDAAAALPLLLQAVLMSYQVEQQVGGLGTYQGTIVTVSEPITGGRGYVAGFTANNEAIIAAVFAVPGNAFEQHQQVMLDIIESIRVPAENGAITQPEPLGQGQGRGRERPLTLFNAGEGRLSIMLPDDYHIVDHVAQENIIAWGDEENAALSRLGAVRADLVERVIPPEDVGGVVVLYTLESLDLTPETLDLAALMTNVLNGLENTGYTIEQPAEAFTAGESDGLFAVVRGAEHGYLALVHFDDKIAYITASVANNRFDDFSEMLSQIFRSVRVPAEEAPPQGRQGLGGLGGQNPLQPPPPGLGGLQPPTGGQGGQGDKQSG